MGVKKQITDFIVFFLSFFLSHLESIKDSGMNCHTPPLKKTKKQGEMPSIPSLGPIPSLNSTFKWHGTEAGYWHFPLFLCFFERWSMTVHPWILLYIGRIFFTVLYEIRTWSRVPITIIQAALKGSSTVQIATITHWMCKVVEVHRIMLCIAILKAGFQWEYDCTWAQAMFQWVAFPSCSGMWNVIAEFGAKWMLHALKQAHRITSPNNLLSLPSKGQHITGNWHHACISILLFLVSLQTSSCLQIAMASCLELPTQSYTACQCIRYPCTCSNRLSCFFIGLKYAISMLLWLYVSILFFEMDVQCRSFSHTNPCTQ